MTKEMKILTVQEAVLNGHFASTQQIYYWWRRSNNVGKHTKDGTVYVDVEELLEWFENNGRQSQRTYLPQMLVSTVEERIAFYETLDNPNAAIGLRNLFESYISNDRIKKMREAIMAVKT